MKTVLNATIGKALRVIFLLCAVAMSQAAAISMGDLLKIFPKYRLFANDRGVAFLLNEQRCVALTDGTNEIGYIFVSPARTGRQTEEEKKKLKAVAVSLAALISELDSSKLKAEAFADGKSGYFIKLRIKILFGVDSMVSECPGGLVRQISSDSAARLCSFDGTELTINSPARKIAKVSFSLLPATFRCFKVAPTLDARKDEERFALAVMVLFEGRGLENIDAIKDIKRKTGAAKCHLTGTVKDPANSSTPVDTAVVTYSRVYYYGVVKDLRMTIQNVRRRTPCKKIEYPAESNDMPEAGSKP